jgi:hypothetical protein
VLGLDGDGDDQDDEEPRNSRVDERCDEQDAKHASVPLRRQHLPLAIHALELVVEMVAIH